MEQFASLRERFACPLHFSTLSDKLFLGCAGDGLPAVGRSLLCRSFGAIPPRRPYPAAKKSVWAQLLCPNSHSRDSYNRCSSGLSLLCNFPENHWQHHVAVKDVGPRQLIRRIRALARKGLSDRVMSREFPLPQTVQPPAVARPGRGTGHG